MKSSLLFVRATATYASRHVQHPPICQGIDRISTPMASPPFSMPTSAAPPMTPTADLCDQSPGLYRTPRIQAHHSHCHHHHHFHCRYHHNHCHRSANHHRSRSHPSQRRWHWPTPRHSLRRCIEREPSTDSLN